MELSNHMSHQILHYVRYISVYRSLFLYHGMVWQFLWWSGNGKGLIAVCCQVSIWRNIKRYIKFISNVDQWFFIAILLEFVLTWHLQVSNLLRVLCIDSYYSEISQLTKILVDTGLLTLTRCLLTTQIHWCWHE